MSPKSIRDRLESARQNAINCGLPARRKDKQLYSILAQCLSICEDVLLDGKVEELREVVRVSIDIRGQQNCGRGRRYAEKTTDVYVLVARAVLDGIDNRNSTYRYGSALRELAKLQVRSSDLVEWLIANGGVKAVYPPKANQGFGSPHQAEIDWDQPVWLVCGPRIAPRYFNDETDAAAAAEHIGRDVRSGVVHVLKTVAIINQAT